MLAVLLGVSVLVLAVILDLIIGDPSPWKPWKRIYNLHPTVWLGLLTKKLEPLFKTSNAKLEKFNGVILALIIILSITVPVYFGLYYLYVFLGAAAYVIAALVIYKFTICIKLETDGAYRADVDDVKVEKKTGESLGNTTLVNGVVLDKEIVHSGMPKRVEKAKIVLLDASLENEKPEIDTKINIESPAQIEAFLKQEETMLKDIVNKILATGANVVVCQKGIDDMVQHFLARKGIIAIRRAKKSDMEKLARATGGKIESDINDISSSDLGYAALVEERRIGDDKMTFVEGCKNPKAVTILIRGGTERLNAEAERSIHDALCVVRDLVQEPRIVAGGGAPELEMSSVLKKYAETLPGREQLAVRVFAEALESIAITLSENAGLDPIDILSELRSRHEKGETWAGIEVLSGKVQDMAKAGVFEPLAVKKQIIKSAYEAASMILKIDDVIASGKSKAPPMPPGGMPGGMGGMGGMGGYPGAGEY